MSWLGAAVPGSLNETHRWSCRCYCGRMPAWLCRGTAPAGTPAAAFLQLPLGWRRPAGRVSLRRIAAARPHDGRSIAPTPHSRNAPPRGPPAIDDPTFPLVFPVPWEFHPDFPSSVVPAWPGSDPCREPSVSPGSVMCDARQFLERLTGGPFRSAGVWLRLNRSLEPAPFRPLGRLADLVCRLSHPVYIRRQPGYAGPPRAHTVDSSRVPAMLAPGVASGYRCRFVVAGELELQRVLRISLVRSAHAEAVDCIEAIRAQPAGVLRPGRSRAGKLPPLAPSTSPYVHPA